MLCLAVTYRIQEGHEEEVAALLRQMVEPTRAEPGNLLYLVHRSPSEAGRFFFYEQYTSQAALDAHRASPHFQQFMVNGVFNFIVSREPVIYELLD
ncbi:MAG: antibiotic biosynthesis monooxygenase [Chloroflexi bacterium]|nr:antibiotic biosynthesis monooxygenase [Chloroflexota bacterium]OJV99878.1 MAG: antibiotic biosynthesis monooxygenase [Chloroflexi bacterium 54-19]